MLFRSSVIPDRKNEYYKNDDDLLAAIGKAMHDEYKHIVDNGMLVQLDDARTAVTYDRMVPPATEKDYLKWVARHVEILNEAIKGLPRETLLGLPVLIGLAAAAALFTLWLLHWRREGRELYAFGGHPVAAVYAGIPVQRRLMMAYKIGRAHV